MDTLQLGFVIGVAVSIDLFCGTIANYNEKYLHPVRWPVGLAVAHIVLFYATSYLLPALTFGYVSEEAFAWVGSGLIWLLVFDLFSEAITGDPLPFGVKAAAERAGLSEDNSAFLLMLTAFSLDAGIVGFVYAGQELPLFTVSLIIGVVVLVAALVSTAIALGLRSLKPEEGTGMHLFNVAGSYFSTTAIATFGVSVLGRTQEIDTTLLQSAGIAAILVGLFFLLTIRLIWKTETQEASAG